MIDNMFGQAAAGSHGASPVPLNVLTAAVQASLSSGTPPDPQTLSLMAQMQMMEQFRKMQEKNNGRRVDDVDSEDSVYENVKENTGLAGIGALKRRFQNHPDRIVRAYLKMVLAQVGVTDKSQYCRMRDWSRKLLAVFGKQRGLWRCHFASQSVSSWRCMVGICNVWR